MTQTDRATPVKEDVHALGQQLGFSTAEEIDETFISIAPDASYAPRVDLVWYLDLRELGLDTEALTDHFDIHDGDPYRRFPLVAWEIEASDVNTKVMEADIANLQSTGAPFGVLVVNESQEDGLYRRGKRILRTVQELYGHTNCLCLDRSQIADLVARDWTPTTERPEFEHDVSEGAGGEKAWSKRVRRHLAEVGKEIGFVVKEDWIPDDLSRAYDRQRDLWGDVSGTTDYQQYTWDPDGQRKSFRGWNTYYTGSKIDLMWTAPYPRSLQSFLESVIDLDPDFKTHTPVVRMAEGLHPFFGFEIESSAGKHAAGGVMNLGVYPTVGHVVVSSETKRKRIEAKIETYERTLGTQNVEAVVMNHD